MTKNIKKRQPELETADLPVPNARSIRDTDSILNYLGQQ